MSSFSETVLLILLAALPCGAAGWFWRKSLEETAARRLVLLLAALFAVAYAAAGIWKYWHYQMGMWDFGIYDSMLHIAASGGPLMHDYRGPFDHFSPSVLLLLPFYWIWDSPYVLLLFQPVAMAAAAPVLYFTALKFLKKPAPALLIAVFYLCNPYYARLALYDFHIECLFPLWFASAFWCGAHRKHGWFLALALTLPLIKEDFIIPLGGVGCWLLSQKGFRLRGALVIAASLFWIGFVLGIYYPFILQAAYRHSGRYELFAPTAAETLVNAWTLASRLFQPSVPGVLLTVLLATGFLPCFSWRGFFFLLFPSLAIQFISANTQQQHLVSHYCSAVAGVAPVAAMFGLRRLRLLQRRRRTSPHWRRAALAGMAGCAAAGHILLGDTITMRYVDFFDRFQGERYGSILSIPFREWEWNRIGELRRHVLCVDEAVSRIPADASVVALNELGPRFVRHRRIASPPGGPDAEVWLFDQGNYSGFEYHTEVNEWLVKLSGDPRWRMIHDPKEGLLLFIRKDRKDILERFMGGNL